MEFYYVRKQLWRQFLSLDHPDPHHPVLRVRQRLGRQLLRAVRRLRLRLLTGLAV